MKLTYHKGQNVGDAINPMLFSHYLGAEMLNDSDAVCLLGVGSILGLKRDVKGKKVVFSSGYGGSDYSGTYGERPLLDDDWEILALRGPLTARDLGVEEASVPLLDGGYLITDVWPRDVESVSGRVGFIPHHRSLNFYEDWISLAKSSGLYMLDVRDEPEKFMRKLWSCEKVICEAMHGAIFADAYRIPWVPIRLYPHINEFKWKDWGESLNLSFTPHTAPEKLHGVNFLTELISERFSFPKAMARLLSLVILEYRRFKVVRWLKRIKQINGGQSEEALLNGKKSALIAQFEVLRTKYSGKV
ncbi:polysaccharide pyruvyl transferase family protein [Akkermansiaceae bacterium]|nr:polysaccharide pyruvyl transferase family protein [Akkermansiaceae bacterium]